MRRKSQRRSFGHVAQRGNAIVEFALVLPLLVVLVLGVADFGRVFYYAVMTANAARAGAQYALRNNYTNVMGIQNACIQDTGLPSAQFNSANVTEASCFLRCPGSATEMTCTVVNLNSCGAEQAYIYSRVRTQFTFNTLVSYPGVPNSTVLHGLAIMRVR
ncbi:MAG: TadE/TadG family type IV pilus assembly protein [Terriglobales bacterium]